MVAVPSHKGHTARGLRAACPANLRPVPAELDVHRNSHGKRRARQRGREIARIAARQYGVIARRQLVELGLSDDSIDYWLSCGRLHCVYRGAFAVGHTPPSVTGRWMAAVLSCGPDALLSHRSAAALWGIVPRPSTPPEVTVGTDRRARPGICVHRASLAPADRTLTRGIPVTSLPRTLLDLAAGTPWSLERALEEAERLELFDLRAVEALLARSRGRRGVARLRSALALYREPSFSRSELERRFIRLVRREGLPVPALNCNVRGHEVDALWPEEQLIVELDGYEYHRTRRAHERDRIRDDNLALEGHDVVRLTWSRLDEPDLGNRIRAHLARRRSELGLDR